MDRIIFHIDVNNAFLSWTAIKLLNDGYKIDIREVVSVIGGDENTRHGIVLAKSPVAKKMGIKTAMSIFEAKKICRDLKIFPPDMEWYRECSNRLMDFLNNYSPNIEQFSIDECFIDFTGTSYLYKDYVGLAYKIKDEIYKKFGFTVNIGVANNKLCAKMASDFEKPNKVHTLFKDEIVKKMWPLDVSELFMVGKATSTKLHNLKINSIKDLANTDINKLEKYFKKYSIYLHNASLGIDDSPVITKSDDRKSISVERTLKNDLDDENKIKNILIDELEEVIRELKNKKMFTKTISIIYKDVNFRKRSSQITLDNYSNNYNEIKDRLIELFNNTYNGSLVRLIGVRLSNLSKDVDYQLSIFSIDKEDNYDELEETIYEINKKFGSNVISTVSDKMYK